MIAGFALVNGSYRFANGRKVVLSERRSDLEVLKAVTDGKAEEPSTIHPAWIIREGWGGQPGWVARREGESLIEGDVLLKSALADEDRRGVVTPEVEERFAEARKRLSYRPGDGTWLDRMRQAAERRGELPEFENSLRLLVSLSEQR